MSDRKCPDGFPGRGFRMKNDKRLAMTTDPKKNKPLHLQAEEAIKKMILLPEYQHGKLLPKEVDFARELGISRNTLRQAINKLVFEGQLCRRKGYGTWVAQQTITSGVRNWLSFSQEMARLGIRIKNYELHVSFEEPDGHAARFFGLGDDSPTPCLKLERVRGRAEYPFVIFISYFNPKFPLESDDNFAMPLYELLESKYGIVVHTSVEEISARLAGKQVAAKLNISENDPILVRRRFVSDVRGVPVEYNIGYYRADSFTYTITAER